MRALVEVGYGCNNHCTFCHTLDRRELNATETTVNHRIDRAAALGHAMVVLSGGEPTARPEIFRWATRIASHGMDLGLVTNGRMLAYPAMVQRLVATRLRYVSVALHGGNAEVHEAITRTASFAQTVAALRNLSGRGLELAIHAVVTRTNVHHLNALTDFVWVFPDAVLRFSLERGGSMDLATAVPAVRTAIERRTAMGLPATHDGFPLCLLPGHEDRHDDLRDRDIAMVATPDATDFAPLDETRRVYPPPCAQCSLQGRCPGLYNSAPQDIARDARSLVARTSGTRANSFNYTLEAEHGALTEEHHESCPVFRDGSAPWDRGRVVFVREGPKDPKGHSAVLRYRANTRDFSSSAMAAITHGQGQIYLDTSDKPAPDDFVHDIVHLQRSGVCAPCPVAESCPGLWERDPSIVNPFLRDDAYVREIVAALRGDVLDVGCGEGPYEDLLGELAGGGKITYTGIDPEPARVQALQVRWPWAKVKVGEAETLGDGPQVDPVDHVLVLRSWNHLRDPRRAVEGFVRVLRPGGTLTVVDNVAFGLVRTRTQSLRAERSQAALEHHRTDGAGDAQAMLDVGGLDLLERRDIGPNTSNQWVLRYRRAG